MCSVVAMAKDSTMSMMDVGVELKYQLGIPMSSSLNRITVKSLMGLNQCLIATLYATCNVGRVWSITG